MSKYEFPLHQAVIVGDIESVEIILRGGRDVNECDYVGWTPLFHAVMNDDVDAFELLLENGADATAITRDHLVSRLVAIAGGMNLFHIAAQFGSISVTKHMLCKACQVSPNPFVSMQSQKNADGFTALDIANIYGKVEVAEILVECFTSTDVLKLPETVYEYESAFTTRIRNKGGCDMEESFAAIKARMPLNGPGKLQTFLALLSALGDNDLDNDSDPAAAAFRAWCTAHDLSGAFADAPSPQEHRKHFGGPLYVACVADSPPAVAALLALGCDPNLRSAAGDTPFLHSCRAGYAACAAALLACPALDPLAATVDRRDVIGQHVPVYSAGGETALHLAVAHGRADVALLLAGHPRARGLVAVRDSFGLSPLDHAMEGLATAGPARCADLQRIVDALSAAEPSAPNHAARRPPTRACVEEARRARATRLAARVLDSDAHACARSRAAACAAAAALPRRASHEAVYRASLLGHDMAWALHPDLAGEPAAVAAAAARPTPGVLAVPLLSRAFCRLLWEELHRYERAAAGRPGLGLAAEVRHDGNWGNLEDCGFRPALAAILELVAPAAAAALCASGAGAGAGRELRARHAFLVRNWPGRGVGASAATFRTHRDRSAVTVNVCLHRTPDAHGSRVLFFAGEGAGAEGGEVPPGDDRVVYRHEHEVGVAVVHGGAQWHRSEPIARGERASLIIWADWDPDGPGPVSVAVGGGPD